VEKKILRLLIVDDSPDDAELAASALRKAHYMLKTQRVQDLPSMQSALDKGAWDVVVCETTLAHFGATMAIELLKRVQHPLPLIVFTHTIREAEVAKLMSSGALDVVRKDEAFRLGPVIERELRIAEERREWRALAQKLAELEGQHRAVVESAREAIGYCQDGMHVDANPIYLELFGYTKGELEGVPVMNLIDKNDQARFKEYLRKGRNETIELLGIKKDGGRLHLELTAAPVKLSGEDAIQVVVSDISKRKAAESRLQYLNQHDPLTGLYNRHHFVQALGTLVDEARKGAATGGIVYFDLNQIKEINDEFGHAAGDRMLLKIARLFRDKLGDDALLARFGGDEFAVLLRSVSAAQLEETARNLCTAFKDTSFAESGKTFTIDCNFGVAVVGKEAPNPQKLLADVYHAAQPARAKTAPAPAPALAPAAAVRKTEPETGPAPTAPPPPAIAPRRPAVAAAALGEWPARIQAALDNNAFELFYQPIVNLHGEPAEYFEVLVRLRDSGGKTISAGEFMPAAERAGLGPAIDLWVTQHAIDSLSELHRQDRRATFFINLCPATFREPDLIVQTKKLLFAAGLKAKYVCFEADEEALLANPAEMRTFLGAVKTLGCRFSVDNFGNNMSNLHQLRDLPISCLKIAGQHIHSLATDSVSQASLKALIQVAKALEKQVIAKSVEKAEDLAILWNLGVDYVQGHYFQEADAGLSYDFGTDTTLSSEITSPPQWAHR
jgi:diguanylate cyclase (GGDEF)-like protein/PAS domain S-box-containing protein